MSEQLAKNLSGKAVMGSDGTQLGSLYNVEMDIDSGALNDLLVSPHSEILTDQLQFDVDEQGRIRVPVNLVQSVEDYIVVQR
ncbi:PRC-barrel domain-containing protein [Haloquadratum walsbyi]|jgi:sporulation protein YlmC with PRC-barrel domain|uniref:PRC domain protein n=1 Tax=Haloquadratum walsbyi (strain DSM 16854 / JCM 12705 / C23) TaxID=768065 RepID=G0LMN0_HALWC|nr:PRC-barrel domain-containing protein [Haloquadratum walsbyi]CCC41350.1 PRC domain protein [Haloquadratum walsbyi C23]